jgi:Ca2+-binding EF-hand superfamily protein
LPPATEAELKKAQKEAEKAAKAEEKERKAQEKEAEKVRKQEAKAANKSKGKEPGPEPEPEPEPEQPPAGSDGFPPLDDGFPPLDEGLPPLPALDTDQAPLPDGLPPPSNHEELPNGPPPPRALTLMEKKAIERKQKQTSGQREFKQATPAVPEGVAGLPKSGGLAPAMAMMMQQAQQSQVKTARAPATGPAPAPARGAEPQRLTTTFTEPGPLGLTLQRRHRQDQDRTSYLVVDRITPGKQADQFPADIRPGLMLQRVNGQLVEHMSVTEVSRLLAPRPVTLEYYYEVGYEDKLYGATRQQAMGLGMASKLLAKARTAQQSVSDQPQGPPPAEPWVEPAPPPAEPWLEPGPPPAELWLEPELQVHARDLDQSMVPPQRKPEMWQQLMEQQRERRIMEYQSPAARTQMGERIELDEYGGFDPDEFLAAQTKRAEREQVTQLMATVQLRNNLAKVPRKEQGDHMRTMFTRIDANGDGFLSKDEITKGLRQEAELARLLHLPQAVGDQDIDAFELIFKDMDSNGDGQISADEFVGFCLTIKEKELSADQPVQTTEGVFEIFDANKGGYLDQQEVTVMIDALGFVVDDAFVGQAMAHFGTYNFDYNTGILTKEQFPAMFRHLLSLKAVDEQEQEPDPEQELQTRRQARAARMQKRHEVADAAKLMLEEAADDDDDAATIFDDGQYSSEEERDDLPELDLPTGFEWEPVIPQPEPEPEPEPAPAPARSSSEQWQAWEAKKRATYGSIRTPVRVRSQIVLEDQAKQRTAVQDSRSSPPRRRSPKRSSPVAALETAAVQPVRGWAEIDRLVPKPVSTQPMSLSASRQRHSENRSTRLTRKKAAVVALESERLRTASQNGAAVAMLSQQLAEMKAIRAQRQKGRLARKVELDAKSPGERSPTALDAPISSLIEEATALDVAAARKIFTPSSPVMRSYVSPVASVPRRSRLSELSYAPGEEGGELDEAGNLTQQQFYDQEGNMTTQMNQPVARDDIEQCFWNCDVDKDGVLALSEIRYILETCSFDVDDAYMQEVANLFGTKDVSGALLGIYQEQFRDMWQHMGLSDVVPPELLQPPAEAPEEDLPPPIPTHSEVERTLASINNPRSGRHSVSPDRDGPPPVSTRGGKVLRADVLGSMADRLGVKEVDDDGPPPVAEQELLRLASMPQNRSPSTARMASELPDLPVQSAAGSATAQMPPYEVVAQSSGRDSPTILMVAAQKEEQATFAAHTVSAAEASGMNAFLGKFWTIDLDQLMENPPDFSAAAGKVQFKEDVDAKNWSACYMAVCPAQAVKVDDGAPCFALLLAEEQKTQHGLEWVVTSVKPLRDCGFSEVTKTNSIVKLPKGVSKGYVVTLSSMAGGLNADQFAFIAATGQGRAAIGSDASTWEQVFGSMVCGAPAVLQSGRLFLRGQKKTAHLETEYRFELVGPKLSYYPLDAPGSGGGGGDAGGGAAGGAAGSISFEEPNTDVNVREDDLSSFEILSANTVFVLRAPSQQECEAWVAMMQRVKDQVDQFTHPPAEGGLVVSEDVAQAFDEPSGPPGGGMDLPPPPPAPTTEGLQAARARQEEAAEDEEVANQFCVLWYQDDAEMDPVLSAEELSELFAAGTITLNLDLWVEGWARRQRVADCAVSMVAEQTHDFSNQLHWYSHDAPEEEQFCNNIEEMCKAIGEGGLDLTCEVWTEGWEHWLRLGDALADHGCMSYAAIGASTDRFLASKGLDHAARCPATP